MTDTLQAFPDKATLKAADQWLGHVPKQDYRQLYEEIENCFDQLVVSGSGNYIQITFGDKEVNVDYEYFMQFRKRIEALFQKEQIQLVTELTKAAKHYTEDGLVVDALDPWAVPVKILEHKKQELERGE